MRCRRRAAAAVSVAVLAVTGVMAGCGAGATRLADPVLGAWRVTATGSPYTGYLFVFDTGSVMVSAGPGDARAGPGALRGAGDGVATGRWYDLGAGRYGGAFVEPGPPAGTRGRAATRTVAFCLTLDGDSLTGVAEATAGGRTRRAVLTGTRVTMP